MQHVLQPEEDQRRGGDRVQPHEVILVAQEIVGQCVQGSERGCRRNSSMIPAAEIPCHDSARKAELQHGDPCHEVADVRLRDQRSQQIQRRGGVVGDCAPEIIAESAGEGIEQGLRLHQMPPQFRQEGQILMNGVSLQQRLSAERPDPELPVNQQQDQHRRQGAEDECSARRGMCFYRKNLFHPRLG